MFRPPSITGGNVTNVAPHKTLREGKLNLDERVVVQRVEGFLAYKNAPALLGYKRLVRE